MFTTEASISVIQGVLALPLILLGLSHILQKKMWLDFFNGLAKMGHAGVVWRTFMLELWPAILIVSFHQDWTWPNIFVTIYGHLLMLKVGLSLLIPELGLRSLQQADRSGSIAFIGAGLALFLLGLMCGYQAYTN
ncbi:MAG: hypothetical protein AAGA72_14680 [Pseudomonadota bacterium]